MYNCLQVSRYAVCECMVSVCERVYTERQWKNKPHLSVSELEGGEKQRGVPERSGRDFL